MASLVMDISDLSAQERQGYLQHAIGPRPICLASTIDLAGQVNLSPFSFFNLFSIDPAVAVFSPSKRLRDRGTKHTLQNLMEVPEVVINIVDYDMVQQVSLSSCEYPKEINEFIKAGFTEIPATRVKPPMVKESKVNLECRVLEIKSLGEKGGAGNLVICEILRIHLDERILNEDGKIDQKKLHQVARLGGNWYCRVDKNNLFEVEKPEVRLGIGIDQLPENIRDSPILTGNNLGALANVAERPALDPAFRDDRLKSIFQYYAQDPAEMEKELHIYAKSLLDQGRVKEAWQVLLTLHEMVPFSHR
jgi:flavin reductase (DIM6/NTAB) family NADH-FMN oxidoreductase RutF